MKCFLFTSFVFTFRYDDLIVPLLRRMLNLEELKLCLPMERLDSTYIDGVQLYDELLSYMIRLNKFTFNIKTWVYNENVPIELPSNEDIQRNFIGRRYERVTSYVHAESMTEGDCHIYTLPFAFDCFVFWNNSFQRGIVNKVRYLMMNDIDPFKPDFFQLISEDFASLAFLHIFCSHPRKVKQHPLAPIIFRHLTLLNLEHTHDDYAEHSLLPMVHIYLVCSITVSDTNHSQR